MPIAPGTRFGPYEIVAPLGAGGMGEVYRAKDPRLGRDVAIKLIPEAFAGDPERLARFEREAKLLASLQHANIAVLHGLEESGGRRFLVMECVEGESLAQRLKRGALPLAETLEAARAIAAALEAAHEGGIVHRDLKPGNVMVTPAGDVKVLDFGLAKGGVGGSSDPNMSASPTLTYAGTQAGVILGTAAYMSPEQARGKGVDRRTDIWSFGCVLYECLTGRQAFAGETVSDIVARILQVEPEWSALPAGTPERLRALLKRCLEKDAKRRLRDIGEARIEIEDLLAAGRSGTVAPAAAIAAAADARAFAPRWGWIALAAALGAAAGVAVPRFLARPPDPPAMRLELLAPKGRALSEEAVTAKISPDGRALAYWAQDSAGASAIWVRPLDSLEPRPLAGTEGGRGFAWSPDGRWLAFVSRDVQLCKVPVEGGAPVRLCDLSSPRGIAWSRDGVLLVAPYSNGGLYRLSAQGGTPVQVTHPDSARGVTGHRFPVFLPDGKHFLFSAVPAGADGLGGLCVGSLDGGPVRELLRVETGAVYAEPGWLVTTRNAMLVAYPFDASALRVTGDPRPLGDVLVGSTFSGAPVMSVARNGLLAFMSRQPLVRRLAWHDAEGRETGAPPVANGPYVSVTLAPDGRRAILEVESEPSRNDLLLVDLERGVTTKLSQPPENATLPVWSRDGTKVAYIDDSRAEIKVRSLADGSVRTLLAADRAYKRVLDWTPDDRGLLIARLDPVTRWDIWVAPLAGDSAPRPCVRTSANEEQGSLSADGRWVSYLSDASGTQELCVSPFMAPGLPYQVTVGGAGGGGWPRGQSELYFGATREPGVVRAAAVRPGPTFALEPSRVVLRLPLDQVGFDLAPGARRVLALEPAERPAPQTITILQGWQAALRGR